MDFKRVFLSVAIKCSLLTFSVLFLFSSISTSDTLILKNGRTIDSPKCWEDGDLIKCKVYGQIIGYHRDQVAEVSIESVPDKPVNGFRFGVWQSGITVEEAIDIAEANNLPFVRSGLITSNKTFNSKSCRPYADTATKFDYKEQLFGRLANVVLVFTPTSKKLSSLGISINGTGPKDSEFQKQIEAMLREKYGKPFKVTNNILFKDYEWKINGNAIVTFRPMSNSIVVTYRDVMLTNLAENEKLNSVRQGFTKGDKDKF